MEKNSFMLCASLMLLVSALWIYAQGEDDRQAPETYEISQEQLSQIVGYSFLKGGFLNVLTIDSVYFPDESHMACDRFRSRYHYDDTERMTTVTVAMHDEVVDAIEHVRRGHFERIEFDCKAIWENGREKESESGT